MVKVIFVTSVDMLIHQVDNCGSKKCGDFSINYVESSLNNAGGSTKRQPRQRNDCMWNCHTNCVESGFRVFMSVTIDGNEATRAEVERTTVAVTVTTAIR